MSHKDEKTSVKCKHWGILASLEAPKTRPDVIKMKASVASLMRLLITARHRCWNKMTSFFQSHLLGGIHFDGYVEDVLKIRVWMKFLDNFCIGVIFFQQTGSMKSSLEESHLFWRVHVSFVTRVKSSFTDQLISPCSFVNRHQIVENSVSLYNCMFQPLRHTEVFREDKSWLWIREDAIWIEENDVSLLKELRR